MYKYSSEARRCEASAESRTRLAWLGELCKVRDESAAMGGEVGVGMVEENDLVLGLSMASGTVCVWYLYSKILDL